MMGFEPTTFCMASLSECHAVPPRAAETPCLGDFDLDGCRLAERTATGRSLAVRLQSVRPS
jgi:hypothetical protein